MAIYHFRCFECEQFVKSFKKEAKCPSCDKPMDRDPHPPNLDVKEILDNGVMTKKVERLVDTENIMKERSKEDIKRKFGLK
jgi:hypothetical protein